jgi:chromosomal replication initiator protein
VFELASEARRRGLILGHIQQDGRRRRVIFVRDIQAAVCAHYGLPAIEMTSQRRARKVARPRQVAMTLSKQMTPQSLPAIGRMFGNRDHTTVIHAVKTVERLCLSDPELRNVVDSLSVGLLLVKH